MKKLIFALSLFLILISVSSCELEDSTVPPGYSKSMIMGTWEDLELADGVKRELVISSNYLLWMLDGAEPEMGYEYKFFNKTITYKIPGMEAFGQVAPEKLSIIDLTNSKLVLVDALNDTTTYKKIK